MTKNILRLDASARKKGSYSRNLLDKLIKQLTGSKQIGAQDIDITTRDLADGIPFIDENWIEANFTAENERTVEQNQYLQTSDGLVNEVNNADLIVIGLPIYNFGVPAVFKAWVDQIVRSKLTFRYDDSGPVGLVKNKKAYIIIVSGGTKLGTEIDFITGYVKHVLGFIGITDVSFIDSSGLGSDETHVLAHANEVIEQI